MTFLLILTSEDHRNETLNLKEEVVGDRPDGRAKLLGDFTDLARQLKNPYGEEQALRHQLQVHLGREDAESALEPRAAPFDSPETATAFRALNGVNGIVSALNSKSVPTLSGKNRFELQPQAQNHVPKRVGTGAPDASRTPLPSMKQSR